MPIFRGELLRGSESICTIAISTELTAPGHAPNTSPPGRPAAPSVMRLGIHPFPRNESKTERCYNVNWLVACCGPFMCICMWFVSRCWALKKPSWTKHFHRILVENNMEKTISRYRSLNFIWENQWAKSMTYSLQKNANWIGRAKTLSQRISSNWKHLSLSH